MNGLTPLEVLSILLCPFVLVYVLWFIDQWLYGRREE
jgi:hypothetical protein